MLFKIKCTSLLAAYCLPVGVRIGTSA